jgi:ATP-dependent DNA helicase RecG
LTAPAPLLRPPGARAPLTLDSAAQYLKGSGPALASRLRALGVERVEQLLFHLPYRYEDRRRFTPLAELKEGEPALIRARVEHHQVRYPGRRMLQVSVSDGAHWLALRFFHFNQSQAAAFAAGRWVRAYGTVRFGKQGPELIHPEYRLAGTADELPPEASLTPCYPLTTGVTQPRLRALIQQALALAAADLSFSEPLPGLHAPDTLAALQVIHRPESGEDAAQLLAGTHPAQQRLIDEELLAHQLCMRVLRARVRSRNAQALPSPAALLPELERALPFTLTGAQRRVVGELGADLARASPMMRLVQGDVGSGKTVVAAA